MLLLHLGVLAAVFLVTGLIRDGKLRSGLITVSSVIFVFFLQPLVPIRNFDFWFPLLTISLTLFTWATCARDPDLHFNTFRGEFLLIFLTIAFIAISRELPFGVIFTASRPPVLSTSFPIIVVLFILLLGRTAVRKPVPQSLYTVFIVILIGLLVIMKTPLLAEKTSVFLRQLSGQQTDTALAADIRWLGYSYIAFRLLSVVIDRKKGRRLFVSPGQFISYVCFPVSLAAGPIDRLDHFVKNLTENKKADETTYESAFKRLGTGMVKKFVLADGLALIALSSQNHSQFITPGWAWFAMFAYSLQIYFDFSGYTDIAIGIGKLAGISLPENFNHPYMKTDIAKFWNNWHMTLTQWIRAYVFNPLTRKFRADKKNPMPQWSMILIAQFVTMSLIGLWHGVTANFLIWGVWHAFGLFIHQLYSDQLKSHLSAMQTKQPALYRFYSLCSWALTFLFVSLGWCWFVLGTPAETLTFYRTLLIGR